MKTRFVVGGAIGLAVAAAAVTAALVLPADAGPKPTGVVGIGKVTQNKDDVKRQIQSGKLVDAPPNDPSFDPQPTSPPTQ